MADLGPGRYSKDREPGPPSRENPHTIGQTPESPHCLCLKQSLQEGGRLPFSPYFWKNHLVSSGTLILPGRLLLSMSLISIIDVLLTHTDKYMSEFTHKCIFSRGSCCFLLQ